MIFREDGIEFETQRGSEIIQKTIIYFHNNSRSLKEELLQLIIVTLKNNGVTGRRNLVGGKKETTADKLDSQGMPFVQITRLAFRSVRLLMKSRTSKKILDDCRQQRRLK